ncbi:MAG: DUF1810 domain-containing protein [Rhizobiaceae bacterium]|nr:DUF1810 domain-containing protein [Rhizobiaceae bacterium]
MTGDPFDLQRFVAAQAPVIDRVFGELRRGRKESHWMWFVFPQIAGLGHSAISRRFAIGSLDEVKAYLRHPVLGQRLLTLTGLVLEQAGSAHDIFGNPDDMKFRSSMTLFAAAGGGAVFQRALDRFFDGSPDPQTIERLRRG